MERSREVAPVIAELRDRADAMRDEVLVQARRRLKNGGDPDEVLEYCTAALLKKVLHNPSVRLRAAGEGADEQFVDTVRELFNLAGDEEA